MTSLEQLAKQTKRLRLDKGWNQYQLAEKAGVHQASISRWETGKGSLNLENLNYILIALGMKAIAVPLYD